MRSLLAPKSRQGQTLLTVLVTTTVMAIAATAFLQMFKSQSNASKNLSAMGGISDLGRALDLQFMGTNCRTSGQWNSAIVGGVASTVIVPSPSLLLPSVPLASVDAATLKGMIQPYAVSSVTMTSLGTGSTTGSGFRYPFRMRLSFINTGKGFDPTPVNKFLTIYTDSNNRVTGACYAGTGSNSGCTLVSNNCMYTAGNVCRVACPAGTFVTSGGCVANGGNGSAPLIQNNNFDSPGLNGWGCAVQFIPTMVVGSTGFETAIARCCAN